MLKCLLALLILSGCASPYKEEVMFYNEYQEWAYSPFQADIDKPLMWNEEENIVMKKSDWQKIEAHVLELIECGWCN